MPSIKPPAVRMYMFSSLQFSFQLFLFQVMRVRPAFWPWGYYDETHLSPALLKGTGDPIHLVWAANYRCHIDTYVVFPGKKLDSEQFLAI
jgi:hypothetical protein